MKITDSVSLIWASKEHYKQYTPDILHSHSDIFHFAFVLSGKAKVLINGEMLSVQENTLYLTSPGEDHNFVATSPTGLFTIEFKFFMKRCHFESQLKNLNERIYVCTPQVRYLISSIIEEGLVKKQYYENIVNLRLCELILILMRDLAASETFCDQVPLIKSNEVYEFAPSKNENDQIYDNYSLNKLIVHMRENLDKEISLEDLSKNINISKGYLIELFKKEYGITPIKYLNKIRLARAKELLTTSAYNINQIAEKTGFPDSRYFSRLFRRAEGITPSEYIEKYRSNLYIFMHGDDLPL